MIGRRQVRAGFSLLATSLVLSVWSLTFAGLAQPPTAIAAMGAASLLATAVLIALSGAALLICGIQPRSGGAQPLAGSPPAVAVLVIRSSDPDSSGRARPRAPGHALDTRRSR